MADTVTQAELRRRVLEAMEDDLRVTPKQGKDFVDSLFAVVTEALEEGSKVSLFGIVNLKPVYVFPRKAGKRLDPRTNEEVSYASKPASVTVRAQVPKKIKDSACSTTSKAGKDLAAAAKQRREAAAKRAEQREKELVGATKGGRK